MVVHRKLFKRERMNFFVSFKIEQRARRMLHLPSMLVYGLLSFSMAFLNKALFEISNFRNSLFVILIQLVFVLLSFEILPRMGLLSKPTINRTDVHAFLLPSIFYSLSTILSLQALMKLNVAIYVVIKVSHRREDRRRKRDCFSF